jgi:hypothetical protein
MSRIERRQSPARRLGQCLPAIWPIMMLRRRKQTLGKRQLGQRKTTSKMIGRKAENRRSRRATSPMIIIFIYRLPLSTTILNNEMSERFSCSPLIHSVKSVDARV